MKGEKKTHCHLQGFLKVIFSTSEATKPIILQQKNIGEMETGNKPLQYLNTHFKKAF